MISLEFEKGEAKKEVKSMESKIEDIKENNQTLEKLLNNYNNPAFIEREARLRLNYKGQGEKVVLVYRNLVLGAASASERFSLKNLSSYQKWWHFLWRY